MKSGKVKNKTIDPEEARALLEQAEDRLEFIKNNKVTDKSAKFIFEAAYEAIRESAQSLMSMKGHKPYSHEATISFVKENHDFTEEEIAKFDYFRKLRADSVYRAVTIVEDDAKECLEFAKKFVGKVKGFAK